MISKKSLNGFTLLEILLVVGIIAILAGIIIIAINPGKQLASVRNVQRKANLAEINKALYQYYIDNSRYPTSVTSALTEICNTGATTTGHSINCTGLADLSYLVPTYLTAIPADPQSTTTGTLYKVMKDTANKIALSATQAELSTTVSLGNVPGPWACGDSITDTRDSKVYTTVLIGTQCWMKQSLNVGTMINDSGNQGVSTTSIQKYCAYNDESYCNTSGGRYQWNQAMASSTTEGAQGICMTGWHIPRDAEYKTLIEGQATPGCESTLGYMCSPAAAHLTTFALGYDNSSGFTGLGTSVGGDTSLLLWTSYDGASATHAFARYMSSLVSTVRWYAYLKTFAFSIRCIKN